MNELELYRNRVNVAKRFTRTRAMGIKELPSGFMIPDQTRARWYWVPARSEEDIENGYEYGPVELDLVSSPLIHKKLWLRPGDMEQVCGVAKSTLRYWRQHGRWSISVYVDPFGMPTILWPWDEVVNCGHKWHEPLTLQRALERWVPAADRQRFAAEGQIRLEKLWEVEGPDATPRSRDYWWEGRGIVPSELYFGND